MLNNAEKEDILSKFPNVKLSYENIIHNKVNNYDYAVAIPEGKKMFVWFTAYKNTNVCYIMELGENKQIISMNQIDCVGSYGTIFYGTLLKGYSRPFFSIEDILFYKGKSTSIYNWITKLEILKTIMTNDIKQPHSDDSIVFGLPLMCHKVEDLNVEIQKIKYKIKQIQLKVFHSYNTLQYIDFKNIHTILGSVNANPINHYEPKHNNTSNTNNTNKKYETKPEINNKQKTNRKSDVVFKIKPDIQNDIYNLYCYNDAETNKITNYDVAFIPDFKTSVMMNKLFRNIKENDNLDILEESDDEEDFENEKEDRFVYLNREYNMVCSYNYKFKKWMPLRLASENVKIVNYKDLV